MTHEQKDPLKLNLGDKIFLTGKIDGLLVDCSKSWTMVVSSWVSDNTT